MLKRHRCKALIKTLSFLSNKVRQSSPEPLRQSRPPLLLNACAFSSGRIRQSPEQQLPPPSETSHSKTPCNPYPLLMNPLKMKCPANKKMHGLKLANNFAVLRVSSCFKNLENFNHSATTAKAVRKLHKKFSQNNSAFVIIITICFAISTVFYLCSKKNALQFFLLFKQF